MPEIKITVTDKRATVVGSPVIVCGNSDYTLAFSFDEEWNGVDAKTARFVYVKAGQVQHEDVLFIGNTVAVPVLSDVAFVKVGVYAGDLCTTTPARILCDVSILCGSGVHHDPTPDVYNQIIALLEELERLGQVQQIEQNRQDIAAIIDGTQTVGNAANAENAASLEGKDAAHFATALALEQLKVELVAELAKKLAGSDVIDNLLSTATNLPLSANQGRVLDEKWAGCWFAFEDADGNPTTEPYVHYLVEEEEASE